ncbi:hypothetical protein ACP70R_018753 [Stipagrostis hirtigluma subsp. patula]
MSLVYKGPLRKRHYGLSLKPHASSSSSNSNLVRVDLHVPINYGYEEEKICVPLWQFVQNFNATKVLKLKLEFAIDHIAIAEKKDQEELLGNRLFHNLERLELQGWYESKSNAAATALRRRPKVSLDGDGYDNCDILEIPCLSEHSFDCLQSYLRRVSLQFHMGKPNCFGLQLAKFFAKNAIVLQEMYIDDGNHRMWEHMNHKIERWIINSSWRRNLPVGTGFRVLPYETVKRTEWDVTSQSHLLCQLQVATVKNPRQVVEANPRWPGVKSFFVILWIFSVAKLCKRVYCIERAKSSYDVGKNAGLVAGYMAQLVQAGRQHDIVVDASSASRVNFMRTCNYAVMGEGGMSRDKTRSGYKRRHIDSILLSSSTTLPPPGHGDGGDDDAEKKKKTKTKKKHHEQLVRVCTTIWELAERDLLFRYNARLRRKREDVCLGVALFFKLLRRTFERCPAAEAGTAQARELVFRGLLELDGGSEAEDAERAFEVTELEMTFLMEHYQAVISV